MKRTLLLLIVIIITHYGYAQEKNYWSATSSPVSRTQAQAGKYFTLDFVGIKTALRSAPVREKAKDRSELILSFPNGDGVVKNFRIVESAVLHPRLAAKYPGIASYAGQGIDDPTATIRFSVSDYDGLKGTIMQADNSTTYIEPAADNLTSYRIHDESEKPSSYTCFTEVPHDLNEVKGASAGRTAAVQARLSDRKLRTYRLALSCAAEYGNYIGGSSGTVAQRKARVLAQMNSTITRVNAIYERDLSITLQLIANNDQLIFLGDVETDPWPFFMGVSWSEYNTKCHQVIHERIGSANYDIGHHFNKLQFSDDYVGSAGCIACTCLAGSKGRAFSIGTEPSLEIFSLLTMHEMGHQMGAYHTQSSAKCISGNGLSEVEPGSGSTLMGYAGICPANVQAMPDAYFHHISINQIADHIYGQSCGTTVNLSNRVPTANAGVDYVIPKSTPFVLNGQASDPDGNTLSYTWEQIDPQDQTTFDHGSPPAFKTSGPVFRSQQPSSSSTRFLPALEYVLANLNNPWEVLPSVGRTLNFSFSVRDNAAGGGQVASDQMKVTVANTGPFRITSLNSPQVLASGSTTTITWDVGGSNAAPVSCANVKISLSTDGGLTFPTTLTSTTPNDGSQSITVPANLASSSCRIKIEAINNIFYDVSDANFAITRSGCIVAKPAGLFVHSIQAQGARLSWPRGNNTSYEVRYRNTGSSTWSTQTVPDQPGNFHISTDINGLSPATTYEAQVRSACSSGASTIVIRARGTSGQEHVNLRINNNLIGSFTATTSMQNYTFSTNATGGITVEFDNDQANRDVQIDYIQVNGVTRQAEAQTYNTGYYVNGACGGSNSEWLHCNGMIGFGDVTGGSATFSEWSNLLAFFTGSLEYHTGDVNTLLAIDRNCDKVNRTNWNTTSDFASWSGVTWSATAPRRVEHLSTYGMTGIMDLGNMDQLKSLSCAYDIQLQGLVLNGATGLTDLDCRGNQFQELNVSAQRALTRLWCSENQITNINFGSITSITDLRCSTNFLRTLNLTALTRLYNLECHENYLTSLNLSNSTALSLVNCRANLLTSLTLTNLNKLQSLYCNNNRLPSLNVTNLTELQDLRCQANQLTSITGIQTLSKLYQLTAGSNQLTSLNLTQNGGLQVLYLENNALTSLALPNPSQLLQLDCSYNKLTTLSLVGQTQLGTLYCHGNKLTSFTVTGDSKTLNTFAGIYNHLPFTELIKIRPGSTDPFYLYAPQNEVFQPVTSLTDITIDYSSQAVVNLQRTTFVFLKNGNFAESNVTGRFRTNGPGIYYCHMFNGNFPDLTLVSAVTNIGDVQVIPASVRITSSPQSVNLLTLNQSDVTVTSNRSWATFNGLESSSDGTSRWANILVAQNTGAERTATISFTFTNPARTQNVVITQIAPGGTLSVPATSNPGSLAIHPNPASTTLRIALPESTPANVSLYTLQGESVLQKAGITSASDLDVSAVKPGIYILKVSTADGTVEKRIVIQNKP